MRRGVGNTDYEERRRNLGEVKIWRCHGHNKIEFEDSNGINNSSIKDLSDNLRLWGLQNLNRKRLPACVCSGV